MNTRTQKRVLGDITNNPIVRSNRSCISKQTKILGVKKHHILKTVTKDIQKPAPVARRPRTACQTTARVAEITKSAKAIDIDTKDLGDHLKAAQFAQEIHFNNLQRQVKFTTTLFPEHLQTEITPRMRAILVDWLVDVHQKFKLRSTTLYLTINILDRYIGLENINRTKLQLVGLACMMVAGKHEEIYPSCAEDFVHIADKSFSLGDLLAMEAEILRVLKWEVSAPTIPMFAARSLKAMSAVSEMSEDVKHMAAYVSELSLVDGCVNLFTPSEIAAGSVSLANEICGRGGEWNENMELHSGVARRTLAVCARELRRIFEHEIDVVGRNKLTAVRRKYSAAQFSSVSTMAL